MDKGQGFETYCTGFKALHFYVLAVQLTYMT